MPVQTGSRNGGMELRDGETSSDLSELRTNAEEFANPANGTATLQELGAPNGGNGNITSFNFAAANDIRLSRYQTKTFASAPGSTVTVDLQNFTLSGHSSLSLIGDATSTFVLNVTGQFSLSGTARIVLSGGIQWNHVFFSVLGTGSAVSMSGKSGLFGTLTASQRTVLVAGNAILYGQVSANRLIIRQAAQVVNPPPVSQ